MGRHFVSHGKLGKSGQLIKAIGNGNLNTDMNIEQNHKTETEENQLFAFPRNIEQLMVCDIPYVSHNARFSKIEFRKLYKSHLGKRRDGKNRRFRSSDQVFKDHNITCHLTPEIKP